MEHFHIIKHLIIVTLVWTQEVVIGNPESQVVVGTFDVVKAVCFPVRSLIGPVQRSTICLNGRYSFDTASSLVSPRT